MVAVLDTDSNAKPVQIIEISIKNIKEKFYSIEDFTASLEDEVFFMATNQLQYQFSNLISILESG
jgi:hypothetical protein